MNTETSIFQEVLQRHPDAALELPAETFRRYIKGILPKSIKWMLRHPDMLRTLADVIDTRHHVQPADFPRPT